MPESIFNNALMSMAHDRTKRAFVDPSSAGGGDPAASAMAQPMPPMPAMGGEDPAAMAGGVAADPAAGGAAPPAAGGGVSIDEVKALVEQMLMQQGGMGGEGMKPEKPKVDVNTEIYQIKKLLVQIADHAGMSVDPNMLLGDPAQDPAIPQEQAAQDPASSAATEAGQGIGSAIGTIDPMQGASPALAAAGGGAAGGGAPAPKTAMDAAMSQGLSLDMDRAQQRTGISHFGLDEMNDKAAALQMLLRRCHGQTNAA